VELSRKLRVPFNDSDINARFAEEECNRHRIKMFRIPQFSNRIDPMSRNPISLFSASPFASLSLSRTYHSVAALTRRDSGGVIATPGNVNGRPELNACKLHQISGLTNSRSIRARARTTVTAACLPSWNTT